MEAYTGFALVYDRFMDNIPYDMWCGYLRQLLVKHGIDSGLVAELGCGTGNMTMRLCKYGYDMIGIDSSEDMLAIAREKLFLQAEADDKAERDSFSDLFMMRDGSHSTKNPDPEKENSSRGEHPKTSILYLQQDMRELELYGTVAAFVSVCDSMNYLLEEQDLLQVFRLVNNYLDPGGLFIFDLKTEYYFENLAENTIAENRSEASFIWENFYDRKTKINQYDLTIYASEELLEKEEYSDGEAEDVEEPNVFFRFDETHFQRAYSLETVKALLEKAGMEFLSAYDAFTEQEPQEKSERIYVLAREGYQKNKLYQSGF